MKQISDEYIKTQISEALDSIEVTGLEDMLKNIELLYAEREEEEKTSHYESHVRFNLRSFFDKVSCYSETTARYAVSVCLPAILIVLTIICHNVVSIKSEAMYMRKEDFIVPKSEITLPSSHNQTTEDDGNTVLPGSAPKIPITGDDLTELDSDSDCLLATIMGDDTYTVIHFGEPIDIDWYGRYTINAFWGDSIISIATKLPESSKDTTYAQQAKWYIEYVNTTDSQKRIFSGQNSESIAPNVETIFARNEGNEFIIKYTKSRDCIPLAADKYNFVLDDKLDNANIVQPEESIMLKDSLSERINEKQQDGLYQYVFNIFTIADQKYVLIEKDS